MGKNVITFRRRKGATDSEEAASRGSRIMVRVGRQRYAIDMSCAATALAAETDPAAERQPRVQDMYAEKERKSAESSGSDQSRTRPIRDRWSPR
jgi:hypothetical protein